MVGTFEVVQGWEEARSAKRAIISLSGQQKSGKTDWALRSSPEPVWYCCFDPNGKLVAKKIAFENKRDIRIIEFSMRDRAAPIGDFQRDWATFKSGFRQVLEANRGTLVVDTGTEMYEVIRLAHFGKVDQIRSRYYGPLNAELKIMFRDLYDSAVSAVFIHKMRKEYKGEDWTGGYEAARWTDMPFQVQANLETWVDLEAIKQWVRGKGGWADEKKGWAFPFHVYVVDCAINMSLCAQDYTADLMGFGPLLEAMYR